MNIILPIAILIYCLLNSFDLFQAWQTAPYERLGMLFFGIWSIPLVYFWVRKREKTKNIYINQYLLWLALAASFFGVIGTLNALKYVGLALALSSFLPWHPILIIWILGAISWMPALGWVGSHYFPSNVTIVRFIIACLASAVAVWHLYRKKSS